MCVRERCLEGEGEGEAEGEGGGEGERVVQREVPEPRTPRSLPPHEIGPVLAQRSLRKVEKSGKGPKTANGDEITVISYPQGQIW